MKSGIGQRLAVMLTTLAIGTALPAAAVEVVFKPVADGVYAYVGDLEGRTYENEGLNANIGLVVTPAGAVLIDSGATFQSARKIHEAAKKVTTQPIRWVINTGAQDHRSLGNGYTPGDALVWLPQKNVLFAGDVVYVDRVLGLHPVSRTKTWLESFAVIDGLQPQIIVPGHGKVTDLATAQAQTRDLLLALRAHMKKAVDDGTDISTAVKSFNGQPFAHLKHADVWIPQLANMTYLEMERE